MVIKSIQTFLIACSLLLCSCTTVQHISKEKVSYDVPSKQSNASTDSVIWNMINPYKVQLDAQMNEVVATLALDLTKKQPESTMGNWVADAMMAGVKRQGYAGDFAVNNYGGMRVPTITKGPLTMGELYELSPFDNTVMIVDIPGNLVDTFFQFIANRDGWPVSSGVRMTMHEKQVSSLQLNGQPVDPSKIYKVVLPDYVANGGDDARFMIALSRVQTGLLLRNVIIDYAKDATKQGKEIQVAVEGRITKN